MTEPTQDLAARRREIVRAVADLSEKHELPMPSIAFIAFEPGHDQLHLRLDENLAEDVARWAELLDNGPVTRAIIGKGDEAFVSVRSDKHAHPGPTWFAAGRVYVCSYCDLPEGGAE